MWFWINENWGFLNEYSKLFYFIIFVIEFEYLYNGILINVRLMMKFFLVDDV